MATQNIVQADGPFVVPVSERHAAIIDPSDTESATVQAAGAALNSVRPDCIATVYTLRGPHGTSVGAFTRRAASREFPDDPDFRRFYPTQFAELDRRSVTREGRWVELVREGHLDITSLRETLVRQRTLKGWAPREHATQVISRLGWPLVCLTLTVPDWSQPLCETDLARASVATAAYIPQLVHHAIAANAEPNLCALEHLLASRADAAFLVSRSGEILGASVPGHRLLGVHASLADSIAMAVTNSPNRNFAIVIDFLGLLLHVTPCSGRGGSPVMLATIGSAENVNRGRLTERQAELIEFLSEGLTNKEIAQRMGLAQPTVKDMLEKLYRVAGVSGRVGLLRWARVTPSVSSPREVRWEG